jgi:phage-related protein
LKKNAGYTVKILRSFNQKGGKNAKKSQGDFKFLKPECGKMPNFLKQIRNSYKSLKNPKHSGKKYQKNTMQINPNYSKLSRIQIIQKASKNNSTDNNATAKTQQEVSPAGGRESIRGSIAQIRFATAHGYIVLAFVASGSLASYWGITALKV